MIPLHRDPWFTFRFADDRIIPRFHLEASRRGGRFRSGESKVLRSGMLMVFSLAVLISIRAAFGFVQPRLSAAASFGKMAPCV